MKSKHEDLKERIIHEPDNKTEVLLESIEKRGIDPHSFNAFNTVTMSEGYGPVMVEKKMVVELNMEEAGILIDVLNRLRQDHHIPPSGFSAKEITRISELYYQIDKNRRETFFGGLPF
ncbi:hypothetical protein [Enterococcus hulanensis]|uniref:hypothetical protein n=1 Tax=Enterococcus hulanensis TaxID=2559929 RepID=UPI0010F8093F|nr:hypothetical protein [Enterococcus hulanensis]